ncbi:transposase [Amycolatopsis magusensis]|uniref:transposase n=1 Tax=Amycolatopsis magusensis TaxID=882444 RepID=UPI0034D4E871
MEQAQFRRATVELVRSSERPLRQVARELGVNHETLRNWVRTTPHRRAGPGRNGQGGGGESGGPSGAAQRVAELELPERSQKGPWCVLHIAPCNGSTRSSMPNSPKSCGQRADARSARRRLR